MKKQRVLSCGLAVSMVAWVCCGLLLAGCSPKVRDPFEKITFVSDDGGAYTCYLDGEAVGDVAQGKQVTAETDNGDHSVKWGNEEAEITVANAGMPHLSAGLTSAIKAGGFSALAAYYDYVNHSLITGNELRASMLGQPPIAAVVPRNGAYVFVNEDGEEFFELGYLDYSLWVSTSAEPLSLDVTVYCSFADLVVVPNVVGMDENDAYNAISEAFLEEGTVTEQYSATVPEGRVISQSPEAGRRVPGNTRVDLVMSRGPEHVAVKY